MSLVGNLVGNQHGYLLKTGSVSHLVPQKQSSGRHMSYSSHELFSESFQEKESEDGRMGPGKEGARMWFQVKSHFQVEREFPELSDKAVLLGQGQPSGEGCRYTQQLLSGSWG